MMRFKAAWLVPSLVILFFILATPAGAFDFSMPDNFAIGAGINQGTENEADELIAIGFKLREHRWEYGIDFCMSEDRGGEGDNNFGFLWAAWIEEFQRPDFQDYGIFAGAGVGAFVLEDDLTDWPAGPFVVIGWDFSSQSGIEGKCGYFGENYWGTAMFYWYFK